MSDRPKLDVLSQPITVEIQNESGQPQPGAVVWRQPMLPSNDASDFPCLRFVDPYGDTVFNQIQIPVFLDDLRRLRESSLSEHQNADIASMEVLIQKYVGKPHFYVKLIGN